MIQVERLVKCYGARRAVDDITFEVSPGTVLGFLGPNGAGKTTTIRMISGFLRPTSGQLRVEGVNVLEDPVAAQQKMGYMPENTPLYEDMTVLEFLNFTAEIRGFRGAARRQRVDDTMARCMISHVRGQLIDTLSKGYRQRVCMAQAILHNPPVLLLDEPTEGLDPNQKRVVRDMIRAMGREKIIVLCTHVLEEVLAICNRVMIISQGKIRADATPAELLKRSGRRNALTLDLVAARTEAIQAFEALPDVARVECLEQAEQRVRLRLTPRDGQPLAVQTLEEARRRNWLVTDIQTDPGQLDDVFAQVTVTEDVTQKPKEEAA